MRRLKDLPLKYQLIIIIFSISLASLWLASLAFVLYDRHAYKENIEHELTVLARIIASQSADAVMTGNHKLAKKNLESLGLKTEIVFACITDLSGKVIAEFSRIELVAVTDVKADSYAYTCNYGQNHISVFGEDYFDLMQPIISQESRKIGVLHIHQDLSGLHKRFKVFSVVMLFIIILASMVAIVLSSRIQKFISNPVLDLKYLADRITSNKDYSLRAVVDRQDELGELIHAFNIMLDTIDQQNRELLKAKQTLEEQVDLRTAELKNINHELEAFIYSVSHDLRSPLRSIDGFGVALLEDCGKNLDKAGKDYLRRIRAASERMNQLIDSLLYLSRVSRQEISMQAVNLSLLADEAMECLRACFPEKTVEFIRPQTLLAYGDKALLMIVMENLLGNAWKYSSKAKSPRIELGSVERMGEPVYFVRDNGVGFDMKYADKLFGPFQRLHRSDEFDGLGVGLATVARIIHRHGGEIWAEGLVGEGAVVYFTLGRRY